MMNYGVNFFGPYAAKDSIGKVATLNITCLDAVKIPHNIHLLSRPGPNESINYATIDDVLIANLQYKINLFHFNARRVPLYFSRLGKDSLKGFYNIGFWVHECPTIPNQWARQLEYFDEIWTPSSLCQSAIAASSNKPVLRIPYPIETRALSSRIEKIISGKSFSYFNFLTIFDIYSDAERKNPLFVIRAFLDAHIDNPSVRLIMKTRNLEQDPSLAEKLDIITKQHKNVIVINGYMETEDLQALYNDADAYVSLHRAEGFGLTISDAMSRGIPIIATGYSGNMDFCNSSDSRLVAYTLRKVGHNRPRYRKNDIWAEPDLSDASEAFKELVKNHKIWVQKAIRARVRLEREFSIETIGNAMKNRIHLITKNFSFPDDMTDRKIDYEVGICDTYGF